MKRLLFIFLGMAGLAAMAANTTPSPQAPPPTPKVQTLQARPPQPPDQQQPQALPVPFPEVRYQQMSAKSPFAIATAAAAPAAAATPGFAAQLYLNGLANIDGKDFVAIKSKDPEKPAALFLEVGGTSDSGMRVDAIHWNDDMSKTSVDISQGADKATIKFDEAQLKSATPQPGPAGVPNPPGIRLPTLPGQQQPRPIGFPQNRLFQPGQTPGMPGVQPGVQPGQPNFSNGMQVRRRRIIQSGQ